MDTRRDFIKKAAYLAGATTAWSALPESIQKALAIEPAQGSTYLDAEHVVILMQENRSFDHTYGSLQGVRGFNDPRAFVQADKKPVWLQTNAAGETYAPFRLDIKETKATWMGSLPHNWANQVHARNGGRYDQWLMAKKSGNASYAAMPLTLGHYTREDIPFYYAFADAFTICDQNFCSSLTGTTANRLFLWTGTIREKPEASSPARVYNEETDHEHNANWTTFPERLEDQGISWKIYQNEIDLPTGLKGAEVSWLSNFGCNPIEYFSQFHVRFAPGFRTYVRKQIETVTGDIEKLQQQIAAMPEANDARTKLEKQLQAKTKLLEFGKSEQERWSAEKFDQLSEREKSLHRRAFTTNTGDPHYRTLDTLTYQENAEQQKLQVPKGDLFHQFRQDVNSGQLPTVSWLVGPEHFSDHPTSAWYGAWYISEVLDILTKNPEVWKKTIFILTYDENDGYFDHVPPFVAPHPTRTETGLASKSIDTTVDFIDLAQDKAARPGYRAQDSALGLGYRVPMVIASPWSRGGCVCSEVFDHTSVLQFLETFLNKKTGKQIKETNISPWRRAMCGDLTSAFQQGLGKKLTAPATPARDAFLEGIHKARLKGLPQNFKGLRPAEIDRVKAEAHASGLLPRQEPGIRPSCALPYQLSAEGALSADKSGFAITLAAGKEVFGERSAGAPFHVYAYQGENKLQSKSYAVAAGDRLADSWALADFAEGRYHLRVDGPNGFHREFQGTAAAPQIAVTVGYTGLPKHLTGAVDVVLVNAESLPVEVELRDRSYRTGVRKQTLTPGSTTTLRVETRNSHGWYDFSLHLPETSGWEYRYAGRVETGKSTYTDPAMGKVAPS